MPVPFSPETGSWPDSCEVVAVPALAVSLRVSIGVDSEQAGMFLVVETGENGFKLSSIRCCSTDGCD